MLSETNDPWLLTPGPLTTSLSIKQAMLHDWGSRDAAFIDMTARVRNRLVDLLGGGDDYVCVPLQGSGTFVVEAAIATMLPTAMDNTESTTSMSRCRNRTISSTAATM